jgi:hypothetical protein
MEDELRTILPMNFGTIVDGWSEGNDHYIALFACYYHKGETKSPLLAFQPLPDYDAPNETEYQLTAAAHKEFIISSDTELIPFIPNRREEQDLRNFMSDLKVFESVSKKLQEADINLLVQRKLFDALFSKYPSTNEYLGPESRIVHSPKFESGICKIIQVGEELDEDEEEELLQFKTHRVMNEDHASFAD